MSSLDIRNLCNAWRAAIDPRRGASAAARRKAETGAEAVASGGLTWCRQDDRRDPAGQGCRAGAARCCGHAPAALPPRPAPPRPGRSPPARRPIGLDPGGALEEVEHRQAGGEAGGAPGRQHVVRPGDVVAQRLRAPGAEEGRAGVADAGEQRLRVGGHDLQVLGRQPVGQRRRLVPVAHQDDGAVRAASLRRRWRRGAGWRSAASTAAATASAKRGVVGDQDRLRRSRRARPGPAGPWRQRAGSLPASASTTTSDGPAMQSMPTRPKTWRLASAT